MGKKSNKLLKKATNLWKKNDEKSQICEISDKLMENSDKLMTHPACNVVATSHFGLKDQDVVDHAEASSKRGN